MTISDPEGVSGDPEFLQDVMHIPCTAAVTIRDLVAMTMASDGVLRCAPADTDVHDPAVRVGVALKTVASGGVVPVVVRGPAIVNTPATGPSISELVILTNAAGVADGAVGDANTVAGDTHGVFLTDEIGTSNTCWCWIN